MAGGALDQLQHHAITNPALPYFPNSSVTSPAPAFISGSNVMTSAVEQCERRPGFPTYTADVYGSTANVQRWFSWHDWSGNYYVMVNVVTSSQSIVYKQKVGTDATFVSLKTDSTTNAFDFVTSNNQVFFGNASIMQKYDGTTVTNWGIDRPSAAVTTSTQAGSLSPIIGYQYVICWNNSTTGHVSSPSPLGNSTGSVSAKQFVVTGNTTTDTQVDYVRIFRTLDGGSTFFEHPSSPIAYATWVASGFTDNTADATPSTPTGVGSYGSQTAPLQHQNDRPTASYMPVYFAGRLWTFLNDTLYFSNYEEQIDGVAVESFSTANARRFGRQITGLSVAGQFLLVFTTGAIYRVYGDSLNTFRNDTLAIKRGTNARNLLFPFGTFGEPGSVQSNTAYVVWLDSSNTVWITDGQSFREISFPIRSDIASIVQTSAAITAHQMGAFNWIVLMDGGAAKLRVYDLDTQQWMPPWALNVNPAGATTPTSIYSGETAAATYRLFLGSDHLPLAMNPSTYADNGNSYAGSATIGLMRVHNQGAISNYGYLHHFEIESNAIPVATVSYLTDEDPFTGSYTAITTSTAAPNRVQGVNLQEYWYDAIGPSARRVSIAMTWSTATTKWVMYSFAIAYKQV